MIANQIIQNSIDDLSSITKVNLCVMDIDGTQVAATYDNDQISAIKIRSFIDSLASNQVIGDDHLFKVMDGNDVAYVLIVKGTNENANVVGRIAVSQMQSLIVAYKERFDKNSFFQNLILDNLLLVDIYNRAKKLRISIDQKRVVFLMEIGKENDTIAMETLKGLFSEKQGDFVTAVDERNLIVIKSVDNESEEELEQIARTIVDMMNAEAMVKVRVTFGMVVSDLKEVSKSYKEAQMAMDVGKIFYGERSIVSYNMLGIGRLIYQLPTNLCEIFLNEIFGGELPDDMDEETLTTINKFFENNLNVSETSRQLYIHRNTLVYRIEKLQKRTGLDIRIFEDALTLRIALMVQNYMKYLKDRK